MDPKYIPRKLSESVEAKERNGKLFEEYKKIGNSLPEDYYAGYDSKGGFYLNLTKPEKGIEIKKSIFYEKHSDPDEDFERSGAIIRYGRQDIFTRKLEVKTQTEDGIAYLKKNFKTIIEKFLEEAFRGEFPIHYPLKVDLEFSTENGNRVIKEKVDTVLTFECEELEFYALEQMKLSEINFIGLKLLRIDNFPRNHFPVGYFST